jgi:DNA polymerase-3 subunit delta
MSSLPSVLLYVGPEDGQKADALDELRSRIEKQTGERPEEHRVYLPEQTISDAIEILSTGSLFSSYRLVLLSDAAAIKRKDEVAALKDYLSAPSKEATLVLLSDEVKVDGKLDRAVPAKQKTIFWELFDNQKRSWVIGYFRKRGVTIEAEAVDLFLELVENNTQELRAEADKLIVYAGGDAITLEDVERHVYHSREESVFSLHKHLVDGDLQAALVVLQKMTGSGSGEPVALIGGLLFQVRRTLSLRALMDQRVSFDEACSKLGIRGKRIQRDYREAVDQYSRDELERQVRILVEYDAVFRELGAGLHQVLLELMLYQLIYRTEALRVGAADEA